MDIKRQSASKAGKNRMIKWKYQVWLQKGVIIRTMTQKTQEMLNCTKFTNGIQGAGGRKIGSRQGVRSEKGRECKRRVEQIVKEGSVKIPYRL